MYSYWSGEIEGMKERLVDDFIKDPSFGNAFRNLVFVLKMRSDFTYFKKKGMVEGNLLPFDFGLVISLFKGAKHSIKKRVIESDSESEI